MKIVKPTLIIITLLISKFFMFDIFAQSDRGLIEVADEVYKFGDIKDALEIYKQAVEANPENAYAQYMTGKCYLESVNKEKSLPFLQKALQLDDHIVPNIYYLIGTAYQLSYDFDSAVIYYNFYRTRVKNERDDANFNGKEEFRKIDRRILECNNGKEFLKKPVNVILENLGAGVNSGFSDYAPVISADQSVLFFTSRRAGSTGGNKANDNEFYEDIYVSYRNNGAWTPATNAGPVINTKLHEACIGISPNGKELFIYKDDDKVKGDIFFCKLDKKGEWSSPKSLGKNINTDYIENSVTISADGKTLYFSSDHPGGKGGMDLYVSKMEKNGEWGVPSSLGDIINTEYDDEGPFIDVDGKTLYFSSRGHQGMGGFDLYKTVFDSISQKWSVPVNLGYPINSPDDDIYFVISGDGKFGYYASVKKDGIGDIDLYRIDMEMNKAPHQVALNKEAAEAPRKALQPVILNLKIFSREGHIPLDARIRIFDKNKNELIKEGMAVKGTYAYTCKENFGGDKVLITVEKDGYIFKDFQISLPALTSKVQNLENIVILDKVQEGYRMVLRNIYFDFDKATIKPESNEELNRLYKFLKDNPSVRIRIEGHTDDFGSSTYNLDLSARRAKAVVAYLNKQGINSSRVESKGCGENVPLATNDDEEEGRELNRRTEFVISKK
jgi:outer membrane protein OmpA-like peptidoglycan-associated protein